MKIFRRVFTAAATIAILVGMGHGSADARTLEEQCNAALPAFKAQCLAQSGTASDSPGVGNVKAVGPRTYLSDFTPLTYKLDENGEVLKDSEGRPIVDKVPSPVFSTAPGTLVGQTDSDGNRVTYADPVYRW